MKDDYESNERTIDADIGRNLTPRESHSADENRDEPESTGDTPRVLEAGCRREHRASDLKGEYVWSLLRTTPPSEARAGARTAGTVSR